MSVSPSPAVLRVSGLSKSFGDVRAVDGLSLEVRRGEIFGLLGPNGAGKTTTIRLICGLLRPDGGSISVHGSIGLSPQSIMIWDALTCAEQLAFMGRMHDLDGKRARQRADKLLEAFGLGEKRNKLGRTLSGGMQRRLNIALALVHDPEVLFLDEPQAGLDPQSRVLVREGIRALADGGTTVVLTTHDMEEAEKLSDRVCIIDRGKVLVLDTVEALEAGLGRGDVVEIEADGDVRCALLPHLPALGADPTSISVRGRLLTMVSGNAAGLLAGVLDLAAKAGVPPGHARVRPRTLEDVFIRLTGRDLRE
jgi:ABC-2 type transport system ATP-binding protein